MLWTRIWYRLRIRIRNRFWITNQIKVMDTHLILVVYRSEVSQVIILETFFMNFHEKRDLSRAMT